MADAKEQILRAAERLFARNGIHRTRVREINELAKQRNASALHYHFGSRDGLLRAIVERHSGPVDQARAGRLAGLGDAPGLRQLVQVILEPLTEQLGSPSGRDYLRIVPQLLDGSVTPPGMMRAFELAGRALPDLPPEVRSERLSSMLLAATTLLSTRAAAVEARATPGLDQAAFVANLIDMATGMLTATVTT